MWALCCAWHRGHSTTAGKTARFSGAAKSSDTALRQTGPSVLQGSLFQYLPWAAGPRTCPFPRLKGQGRGQILPEPTYFGTPGSLLFTKMPRPAPAPGPLPMGYFPSVTPILSTQQECTFYQIAPLACTPSMWLPEGRDLPGLPTAVNKELESRI